jgi:uncharacterized protein (DUF362 family)
MNLPRRAFLRLALLSGIAAGVSVIYHSTESIGFERWFRWMLRGNATRLFGPRARVALLDCPSYESDLVGALRGAWSVVQMPDLHGARVVIKPNLVDYSEGHPTYTDPRVVQAAIRFAREQGAREINVAEGIAFRRDPEAVLDATGYTEMLAREDVPFVDLNHDDLVPIPLRGGYLNLKTLLMGKTVREADVLISIPKLKTHHWTTISASIKNLFGLVPGIKYGWPKNTLHIQGIPASLAELVDSLPPRGCAIVDGVVGMQGDGPLSGDAVASGVMVAGADMLAVDSICARLMGFDPASISYLSFAAWAGIGMGDESKIDLVGGPLARYQRTYTRPPAL